MLDVLRLARRTPLVLALGCLAPPNHLVNDRDGDPSGRVQSEVALAVHGDTIVALWNDAVGYYENVSMCGYGVSLDGGHTWIDGGELPNGPTMSVSGDPWIVAAPDGTFIAVSVDTGNDDGIAVHRGRVSGGVFAWDPPSTYIRAGGEALDKPAIDIDPASGALYLTYVNWSQNRGELARSDDLGVSWHEPIVIHDSSRSTGYVPAAGTDGAVLVAWVERAGEPLSRLLVRCSEDGGTTWATPPVAFTTLGPHAHEPPLGYNRVVNAMFPSIAVDRSGSPWRGRVHAVWTDGAPGTFEIFHASSDDGGRTWTAARRVRDDEAGGDAFWPRVRTGAAGCTVVGWYDRRHAGEGGSDTGFTVAASLDGGASFGPDRPMSDAAVPWQGVPADFTPNFGDYVDIALDAHTLTAGWSDARAGDPDVIVARRRDRVPARLRVTRDGSTHTLSGDVWMLADEIVVPSIPPALDPLETALAAWPFTLLASAERVCGALSPEGGEATGTLLVEADEGPIATASFRLVGSGEDPADTLSLDITVTAADGGTPGARSTHAGGADIRWESAVGVMPGPGGTLAVHGRMATSEGDARVLGFVALESRESPRLHLSGWHIRQEGWTTTGNLRARTRVSAGAVIVEPAGARNATRDGITAPSSGPRVQLTPNPVAAGTRLVVRGPGPGDDALHIYHVRIYDVRGRWYRTIVAPLTGGEGISLPFDARDALGRPLAPGVYLVRLRSPAGSVVASTKAVVLP